MADLSKNQLLQKIAESINESGWNVIYIKTQHPFELSIFKGKENRKIRIFIWNISHGGGSRRPEHEFRIQVKVKRPFQEEDGLTTLIIGWWDEVGVFAGFDIRKHLGTPGWSASFQIAEQTLIEAYEFGFSASEKGNQEIAVGFRPDFFVHYVFNLRHLHDFGKSTKDLNVLKEITKNLEINETDILITNRERKKTAVTVQKKLRDNSFKSRVLTAYSFKCSVCGIQLKLVDAAHIVPVHENGTDETSNGLALCSLHHRAYDKSLITIWEDYSVKTNQNKIKNLIKNNLNAGLENFKSNLKPIIHIPPALSDRPHRTYIKKSNQIRGW